MTLLPARARFEALVPEVVEPVRRYLARRVDAATADEVLGDVLLVLWRRLDDVPAGDEVPWAVGVARLQLSNALRSMRRRDRLVARIVTVDPPTESVPEADEVDPRVALVAPALARLREVDAEVLRLHVWDELTVAQAAAVLGTTPNAVSIRLHRARRRLADEIRKAEARDGHAPVTGGDGR